MKSTNTPKLVVFDLDFTLWPLWVDTHVNPPFTVDQKGHVFDCSGYKVELFKDTLSVLKHLQKEGIKVAAASRTGAIQCAEELLKMFDLNKYFVAKQIYPGCKLAHFEYFHKTLKIDYKDMLFFDDEKRNIVDLKTVGVTAIHAPEGISHKLLKTGMKNFANNNL